jgi:hypothetical protein
VADLTTGATTLVDAGEGGVWSPDGRQLLFARTGEGLFRRAADGPGPAELVLAESEDCVPAQWVEGVDPIVVRSVPDVPGGQQYDIEQLPWAGSERRLRPLRSGPKGERCPALSPDRRWLAYDSEESGRRDVYVDSFADGSARRQVSTDGGSCPAWSGDGRELFYLAPRGPGQRLPRMMSVRVLGSEPLRLAVPTTLFEFDHHELSFAGTPTRIYDVAPDGQAFYAVVRVGPPSEASDVTHIGLVLNWAEELKARIPVGE